MSLRRPPLAPHPPPLSILFLQTDTRVGGTEQLNLRTAEALQTRGHDVTIFCLDGEGPLDAAYRAAGVAPRYFNSRARSAPAVWRELRAALRDAAADIVHLFGLRSNLFGRTAAQNATSAKLVTTQSSIDPWRRWWHNALDRSTGHLVDQHIAVSYAVGHWLRDALHVPAEQISVIHSGIDPAPFAHAPTGHLRPAIGAAPGDHMLVCVANFDPAKRHDLLLDAVSRLQPRRTTHLVLVGDSTSHGRSDSALAVVRAGQLPNGVRVHPLGRRSDVPAIFADADISLLASDWEGLPVSVMESMAAGLPVVATRVGGVPELVEDGVTGLLTPPGDAARLAAAVDTLLHAPDLRRQMGAAGEARLRAHFSVDHASAALLAVYARLLSDAPIVPIPAQR